MRSRADYTRDLERRLQETEERMRRPILILDTTDDRNRELDSETKRMIRELDRLVVLWREFRGYMGHSFDCEFRMRHREPFLSVPLNQCVCGLYRLRAELNGLTTKMLDDGDWDDGDEPTEGHDPLGNRIYKTGYEQGYLDAQKVGAPTFSKSERRPHE